MIGIITATVDAFSAEGYTIKSIDRKTGFVRTGKKSNATMKAAFVGDKSRSIQAMIKQKSDSQSELTLTLVWKSENVFGQSNAQSTSKSAAIDMYKEWFTRIESKLNASQTE